MQVCGQKLVEKNDFFRCAQGWGVKTAYLRNLAKLVTTALARTRTAGCRECVAELCYLHVSD